MIKAGYQLVLSSWENDGDNSQDITISGLSDSRVRYIVALCQEFTSSKLGNKYEATEKLTRIAASTIIRIMSQHLSALEGEELLQAAEEPSSYMAEFLGSGEGYDFRAFSHFRVFYLPMNIEDVTAKFE